MVKLISAKKLTKRLQSGEIMQYIPVPEWSYKELEEDLKAGKHFSEILALDMAGANGVIIKCDYLEDGLLAASYIYKKYQSTNESKEFDSGNLDEEEWDEYSAGGEDFDNDWEEEDERGDAESIIFDDDYNVAHLPILNVFEFSVALVDGPRPIYGGFNNFNTVMGEEGKSRKPYWFNGNYPLIICSQFPGDQLPIEEIKRSGRLIIYITVEKEQTGFFGSPGLLDQSNKKLMFECDFECVRVEEPSREYYQLILEQCVKEKGYKIAKTVDKGNLIDELKNYRGNNFASNLDIEILVNKAVKKKDTTSKTLSKSNFEKIFITHERNAKRTKDSQKKAFEELNMLIGLDDVKGQLNRIVKRMIFDKERRLKGYKTTAPHASAVFMGNPGTAKTTTARIFGKLLCEAGVLENEKFVEVSRKDLVGMFVGWTAPTVAKVFESARGGTLFIDEAYSLLNEGRSDSFSDEAIAEIIRQMENNPNTLVIFAGYTNEMRKFIKNANPGLRSRLTNIIEFKDYLSEEMFEIFNYLLNKEDYVVRNLKEAQNDVNKLINCLSGLESKNLGNGRLMRKLFKTAIGFMAERDDNDMRTIHAIDITKAVDEIIQAEMMTSGEQVNRIGF